MTLYQPRRAVLYVPASHQKALAKSTQLQPDAIIYDLEDSVAEQMKHEARDNLRAHFQEQHQTERSPLKAIRINSLATQWGEDDLKLAAELKTEAIVLPKTETPQQVIDAARKLDDYDTPETLGIWAMIETPRGILNADEIARLAQKSAARLKCFIVGTNDIALSTGVKTVNQRSALLPWMMQIILAARAGGIDVLDGVYNNFQDQEGFKAECEQGAMLGFDGKTLIHPSQIETALNSYSSTAEEAAWANQVIAAFNLPENAAKGAISLNGSMVEQLHIRQAERVLARAR
ncbi:CoA ester lyase [Pseudochrobactrum sp. XF203]|uniref:HpcH/HpaI aldolase/citrate lyase family protein n=1 Tax=Pseudochrobactrum sp. XF203 TaxID=2879116 RepID=UPI001CE3A283|nr:CoA ester lyase [Pseudochrobactrum sp. XF203]UCA45460.1 CoA ester lyase [Pseudochrobactrum sp. XF203]